MTKIGFLLPIFYFVVGAVGSLPHCDRLAYHGRVAAHDGLQGRGVEYDERRWDEAFARSQDQLARLAARVREDISAGRVRRVGMDEL